MQITKLRARHPEFHYRSFHVAPDGGDLVRVSYDFLLEPDIELKPQLLLPMPPGAPLERFRNLFFHLGLIEMISYWKAACPPIVRIHAGYLSGEQLKWWHDLFIYGLQEFFYINSVDFADPELLTLRGEAGAGSAAAAQSFAPRPGSNLIMVGGGKDSAVTLELLRSEFPDSAALLLNPTRAALDSARLADYTQPVIVMRTIDPALLALNAQGYLNGHTPFSAYLAFLGVLMAAAHGYENVIASNETSSDEPNLTVRGIPVNHQYSKSLRFEDRFRGYIRSGLTTDNGYFSFLRPLHEIQISRIFARQPRHFRTFRSCNVQQQRSSWCCTCAKCVFVWLSLYPFVPKHELDAIFGSDLALLPQNERLFRELLGLGKHKPFECVGTIAETALALRLSLEKCREEGREPPELFSRLDRELTALHSEDYADYSILDSWSDEHFLPQRYEQLLKEALLDAAE